MTTEQEQPDDDDTVGIEVRVLRRHLARMQAFNSPNDNLMAWVELSSASGTMRLPVLAFTVPK